MTKAQAKRSSMSGMTVLETHPSAGETVTYQLDAAIDRELGLSTALKKSHAAFEAVVATAAAKGFVLRGELASEGHHLVVIERAPGA